ncbi:bifunctional chorismate mutase/prephenate dehydratase [Bacilliculturomica massiliensis]|uniref:bifunctional chorismate mutase/prephenate dehydratase n=1 Tax=Bacilliculturomica massiliensis TaxID=1917867 RepID=UPI001FE467DA|nr:bifunctional chorismate mutase/prephenate dehydratase [Bacilliculturomica massiliensis]
MNKKMELMDIRTEIDKTDDEITKLFLRRMELAAQVAQYKKEKNIGVTNKSREREILNRVTDMSGELAGYARVLYSTLFDVSRSYQRQLNSGESRLSKEIKKALEETPRLFPKKGVVACQGVEGAYSQIACDKLFPMANIMYFKNFEAVFNAVEKGLCDFGILPIENSSNGSVSEVYDLMRHYQFHIVKGIKLCVAHELLAKPGTKLSDIKKIVSHEQAIGQCSEFLKGLADVEIIPCENTAMAAEYVASAEEDGVAAISSHNCAELYGLSCVSDKIQNNANNYTRFICISKGLAIYPGADRISLMLSASHQPGALYNIIAKFAVLGLNLTKLESRPIVGKDFEFQFYFDFDASVNAPEVINLLSDISQSDDTFMFLGNYSEI